MKEEVQCHKCKKQFKYNEGPDKENKDLVPKKIRKVVIDENNVVVPFYEIPADKRRMVNEKFIKFECSDCTKLI